MRSSGEREINREPLVFRYNSKRSVRSKKQPHSSGFGENGEVLFERPPRGDHVQIYRRRLISPKTDDFRNFSDRGAYEREPQPAEVSKRQNKILQLFFACIALAVVTHTLPKGNRGKKEEQ